MKDEEEELAGFAAFILPPPSLILLFGFLVTSVLAATATKLLKLEPVGRGFLVLCRYVVPALTVSTLKHNVIARHNLPLYSCS